MKNLVKWRLKQLVWLFLSAFLLVGAVAICYFPQQKIIYKILNKPYIQGIQTSFMIGNYDMSDHNGNRVTWKQLSTRPLYITTGFTRCAYSCPITMSLYQQLFNSIDEEVNFALLTVDPENDNNNILSSYLNSINTSFIGLRIADKKQLAHAIFDLKQNVFSKKDSDNILHASNIYLIHPLLNGLIIYTEPNLHVIVEDLNTINTML